MLLIYILCISYILALVDHPQEFSRMELLADDEGFGSKVGVNSLIFTCISKTAFNFLIFPNTLTHKTDSNLH